MSFSARDPCGKQPTGRAVYRLGMRRRGLGLHSFGFVVLVAAAGCGGEPQIRPLPQSPTDVQASNQIIGTRAEGTAKELLAKGEKALLSQRWQEAVDAFEAV